MGFRLRKLEEDVDHLQERLEDYAGLKQTVAAQGRQLEQLGQEFTALRRALYTAALTIGGSAVVIAFAEVANR